MLTPVKTIIFDLGGVLLDWNPMYVYNDTYFESQEKRDYFFSTVCTGDWNEEQDAGQTCYADPLPEQWISYAS